MTEVTDVYSIIDFKWDGASHWSLASNEAEELLKIWIEDVPARISKLRDLMIFDGQKLAEGGFSSADLTTIEYYLLSQSGFCEQSPKNDQYLDNFSFEICKDAAAVVGQMCINANPNLEWSINTDGSSGPKFQSIGIISSATNEHIPIPMLIYEYIEETLKQKKSLLGRFKRARGDVLLNIVVITSFIPEAPDA